MVKNSTEGNSTKANGGNNTRDVGYEMLSTDVLELALNAAPWGKNYPQSEEVTAAAKSIGEAAEFAAQEKEREATILELQQAILTTDDSAKQGQLETLLSQVRAAKPGSDMRGLLIVAAAAAASVNSGSASAEAIDTAAMHKSLYANDAVYRAKVDEITAQAVVVMTESEKRRANSDAIAQKYGIHTDYDEEMEELTERYKLLDPKSFAADALRTQMLHKERAQNNARIEQLEQGGHHADAEVLRANQPPIDTAIDTAKALYKEKQTAYLEALERKLVAERILSPEKIKESLAAETKYSDDLLRNAKTVEDLANETKILKEKQEDMKKQTQEKLEKQVIEAASAPATVSAPSQNMAMEKKVFAVAEANINSIAIASVPDVKPESKGIVGTM